jgi:O-antigen/teichoic acid export membrane protein
VTPETTAEDLADPVNQAPSTAGMTTRVLKGSIWTLAGQALPLFASLATTPLIIRILGSEGYGVLILITLIPTYFSFSELGMGTASTRFASAAYAKGDLKNEGRAIRTAAMIALICSLVVAVPIIVFAQPIIGFFNVPESLHADAITGLRLCSVTFVIAILCGVINTAQLTRLRMDMNATINGASKVTASVGTVIVLYFGWGIVGAAWWFVVIGLVTLAAHTLVSGRLLKQFFDLSIDRDLIKPLIRFGGALALSAVAAVLLVNIEKLLVGRMISVRSLAFYSVAFIVASMAATFSMTLSQSLVPAFSQLLSPEKRRSFDDLFARSLKLCVIWLLPVLMLLFVAARPFFTLWAGPDFGRESTVPFYILLVGLLFSVSAIVPWSSIVAVGRTDLIAKIYWAELVPYAAVAAVLINYYGIIGAAAAWSLRAAADAVVFVWFSSRVTGAHLGLSRTIPAAIFGFAVLAPPGLIAAFYDNMSPILLVAVPVCAGLYVLVVWKVFITPGEREWIVAKVRARSNSSVLLSVKSAGQ